MKSFEDVTRDRLSDVDKKASLAAELKKWNPCWWRFQGVLTVRSSSLWHMKPWETSIGCHGGIPRSSPFGNALKQWLSCVKMEIPHLLISSHEMDLSKFTWPTARTAAIIAKRPFAEPSMRLRVKKGFIMWYTVPMWTI
jgi:hypothetical protein